MWERDVREMCERESKSEPIGLLDLFFWRTLTIEAGPSIHVCWTPKQELLTTLQFFRYNVSMKNRLVFLKGEYLLQVLGCPELCCCYFTSLLYFPQLLKLKTIKHFDHTWLSHVGTHSFSSTCSNFKVLPKSQVLIKWGPPVWFELFVQSNHIIGNQTLKQEARWLRAKIKI